MKQNPKFDLLRLLACFMVILMHAPLPDGAAGNGLFLSALSYFTAPCIGLFFMVSGALLLPVRSDTGTFLKRRFGKVLLPTLAWSVFYLCCNRWMKGETVDWGHALCSMPFSTQGNPVLWFMYTLMGLYLLAPVLSRWLEAASRKEVEFYLGLWGVSLCYPLLSWVADCNTGNTGILYYFTGYAGYFVLGYYLNNYPGCLPLKSILPAAVVAIVAPVVCKVCRWEVDFYELFWYLSVFVVVQCVCWYRAVECIVGGKTLQFSILNIATILSRLSFGIYLVHIFVMRYLLWNYESIRAVGSYILQTGIITVLTFALSAIVCWLISFLPGAQYLIGYRRVGTRK